MTTKNLNVRIDEDLKTQAERIFNELGITTSTAITMFLKSTVRLGGFPCDLSLNNERNPETIQKENMKKMEKNKAWEFALGMIKTDELEPSADFLKLVEQEKKGEITTGDIRKTLDQKYRMKGATDHE